MAFGTRNLKYWALGPSWSLSIISKLTLGCRLWASHYAGVSLSLSLALSINLGIGYPSTWSLHTPAALRLSSYALTELPHALLQARVWGLCKGSSYCDRQTCLHLPSRCTPRLGPLEATPSQVPGPTQRPGARPAARARPLVFHSAVAL